MNEPLSSKIKCEMDISSIDPELLHNCIEEFDRVIFQVPQQFSINSMEDQLNHFTSSRDDFDGDNDNQSSRG